MAGGRRVDDDPIKRSARKHYFEFWMKYHAFINQNLAFLKTLFWIVVDTGSRPRGDVSIRPMQRFRLRPGAPSPALSENPVISNRL